MVERLQRGSPPLRVALVGKYTQLHDAYISVTESLRHAAAYYERELELKWINSEELEEEERRAPGYALERALGDVRGVVVPGGFGSRGIEGKIMAIRYAREQGLPFLGLCLGMQCAVIEFARHVLGSEAPNSTEFDPGTPHPVIDYMADQQADGAKGGTMRLGLYPCYLQAGLPRGRGLRHGPGAGAPPAPAGVQQRLPGAAGGARDGLQRAVPGRAPGGDRRAAGAPLVRGDAVPPRV